MEVMVAVMIVSVVIAALLKLRGDTSHLFMQMQKSQKESSIATFLLWNRDYGLDKSSTNLYSLVENFDIDDALRRELKNVKVEIKYQRVKTIEMDMLIFEIGKTELSTKDFDISLNRVILR
jgi:hypothetical protein